MYNIQEAKISVDPKDVCEKHNIEYKEIGGRLSVLCPFHGDRHFGSAYIRDGYFKCFSCEESMDIITLVQRVAGISFSEALKEIAELAGLAPSFGLFKDDGYTKFRLSKEEENALKIPVATISLKMIYKESPELYKSIVIDKATKMLSVYEEIIKKYGSRTADEAVEVYYLFDGKISAETYRNIEVEAKSRIRICQDIVERMT